MDIAELGYRIDSREAIIAQRNLDRMGRSTQGVDRTAAALTTRMVALGGAVAAAFSLNGAINQARALDASIGELSTLLPGATAELDRMTASARQFATTYGTQSQAQVAAYYAAVSAGATNAMEATARVNAANRLAIGGASNLASAIEILNTATNAYADSGLSAADASDILFTGVRTGVTTINELSATIGRAVPAAAALGVEFDQLVGGVSALTTQGQSTDIAVTSLTAAMSQLLNPSEQARLIARQLGIDFSATAVEAMGLAGFMETVTEAAGGNQETLAQLFGSVEALRAVFSLAGQGGVRFAAIMEEMETRAGAADAAYQTMAERMSNRFNRVMSEARERVEAVGDVLLSVFVIAAERAISVIERFEEPTLAMDIAMKAAAVTAGVLLVTRLYTLTAALAANAASAIAATGTYTIYNMVLIRYGQSAAIAAAATHALGVAVKVALGPVGIAIAAVGMLTAAWVAGGNELAAARAAQEELNARVEEGRRLSETSAVATEEAARANLMRVRAIREEIAAQLELNRTMMRLAMDQFNEGGSNFFDFSGMSGLIEASGYQQQINETTAALNDNAEAITRLERLMVDLGNAGAEEAMRAVEMAVLRQQDAVDEATASYRRHMQALTLNNQVREENLMLLAMEDKIQDDAIAGRERLTEAQRQSLISAHRELRAHEDLIDVYDRLNAPMVEHQRRVEALNGLMATGAVTAGQFAVEMQRANSALLQDTVDMGIGTPEQGLMAALDRFAERGRNVAGMLRDTFADLYGSVAAGAADAFGRAIVYGESFGDAIVGGAQSALATLIAAVIEFGIQWAVAQVLGQSVAAAAGAASIAQAAAVGAAWAPAAAAVSLASFGANAAPAMAGMSATYGLSQALSSVAGFRDGGYTGDGPVSGVAGVVHGQEYVFDAASTRRIGRENLDAMRRGAPSPSNDNGRGGGNTVNVTIGEIRAGSDVSRAEVVRAVQLGVAEGIDGQVPAKVMETLRGNMDRSGNIWNV